MHHTAAAVLRPLSRFVFKLAAAEKKKGAEVCRDTCLHTRTKRGSQAPPPLSGLKICVVQQLPCLVAGWHGGTSYCMYGTVGGIVESPSSHTTVPPPPPPNQASRMQREWGRGRDQGCWNDCRLFLTQRRGNGADWQVLLQQQERTTAAVPLFSSSACPVVTLARRACARGDQGV